MADRELKVVLNAKDNASAQISKAASTIGKSFTVIGGGITAAMGLAVKAAGDAQVQMQKFNTILDATGTATETVKAQLQDAADATLKLGFDNEEAAVSLANFYRRTNDVAQATKLNNIAMDLARAKNLDLASANTLVGQVLSGNGKLLKSYGISLKEAGTPMEALDELQTKLKGSAQDFAQTAAGQAEILNQNYGELVENVGSKLLPVVQRLAAAIIPVVEKMVAWADSHPKLTNAIVLVVAALGALMTVIGPVLLALPALTAAATAFGAVLAFIAANPIVLIIAAIVALGAAIYLIATHWTQVKEILSKVWDAIVAKMTAAFEWMKNAFASVFDAIVKTVQGGGLLLAIAFGPIGILIYELITHWQQVQAIVQQVWDAVQTATINAFGVLKKFFDKSTAPLVAVWTTVWNGLLSAFRAIWDEIGKIVNQKIEEIKGALSTVQTILNAVAKYSGASLAYNLGTKAGEKLTGKASGGFVSAGTPYMVGEHGPELFMPSSSGNIVPNGKLGGANVNVTVNVASVSNGVDVKEMARTVGDEILRGLRQNMLVNV